MIQRVAIEELSPQESLDHLEAGSDERHRRPDKNRTLRMERDGPEGEERKQDGEVADLVTRSVVQAS
jgi:hypothetical protein